MKIAVFTNTYLPHVGGVANSVSSLVAGMRARGHRCLVVAPEFPGQPEREEDVLRIPSITNFNGTDFSFRLPSGTLIGDSIKAFQPDLIHSHHPFLLGDAALRMAHQWQVPLVFTHHTRYEKYVHYVLEDADWLKRLAIELATEYANLCDRVIAPSRSIADLIRHRGVDAPVSVIPTGIDYERFRKGDRATARKNLGISPDAFVIGHVGRLAPEKNLPFLFKAVTLYLREHPDSRFLVLGKGDSLPELKRILREAAVEDRVHLAGKLTGQELVDFYHAMDLFAFASKSETQGMVLAEAMAAGVPVLALEASGASDIVNHGENGLLLPANCSREEFARAIGALRQLSRDKRDTISARMEETAKGYSSEVSLDRIEVAYKDLIRKERGERDLPGWTRFMNRLEAEWDLGIGRARALGAAFQKPEPE